MGIKKGTTWKGIFADPRNGIGTIPMSLEITAVTKKAFRGITKYPKNEINVRGMLAGADVYFVEYEVVKGEALIPNTYQGKLVDNTISGISTHANMQATFFVELQK
jgi:hypothetical protein